VLEQLPERAADGDIVLVCGVFLSPLLVADGEALLRTLKQRGFTVALDTGWPNEGWDAVRTQVASWLPNVDHVLFNEVETTGLAGLDDLDDAAKWFRAHLPSNATLVTKCGAEGAVAWQGEGRVVCPAQGVQVIDTIGAGDAFNAGYLLGLATGCGLSDCLSMGVTTASCAISTSPRRYREQ
jgi:sugar/nucleoside kinase (ribokinase family)